MFVCELVGDVIYGGGEEAGRSQEKGGGDTEG